MTAIGAIAGLTLRSAFRSRTVLVLTSLLLLIVLGVPITVEGDGTAGGHVQIVLEYTLNLVRLVLALVAIWLGCTAISGDIADRHLQLVITKPVPLLHIWLGKWLGILTVLGALLLIASAGTYALLHYTSSRLFPTPQARRALQEEILTSHRTIHPRPVDVGRTARDVYRDRSRKGLMPPDMDRAQALHIIRKQLMLEECSVRPGEVRQWIFDAGESSDKTPLQLQYRFDSSLQERRALAGIWFFGSPEDPRLYQARCMAAPGGVYQISIPPDAAGPEGRLLAEYALVDPKPVVVLFTRDNAVVLLQKAGGFAGNFVKAITMILIQLAMLAAMGITAGICCSTPVAAFISFCMVVFFSIGPFLHRLAQTDVFFGLSHHGPLPTPHWWDYALKTFFRLFSMFVSWFEMPDVLTRLATGHLISWMELLINFTGHILVICTLLALLGTWVLRHREVGLST